LSRRAALPAGAVRTAGDDRAAHAREAKAMTRGARRDRAGQSLVEYALIILLIAIAAIMAVSLLAPQISGVFARITASLGG
jgi:Flp pilus assembly pilin Flp